MRFREFTWRRSTNSKLHHTIAINSGKRQVQVTESPSGRSLQVHVLDADGWRKVYP